MEIREAITKALYDGKTMRRADRVFNLYIKPDNANGPISVYDENCHRVARGWEPSVSDLLSSKWEVV